MPRLPQRVRSALGLLSVLAATFFPSIHAATETGTPPPNVLMLVSDDQG